MLWNRCTLAFLISLFLLTNACSQTNRTDKSSQIQDDKQVELSSAQALLQSLPDQPPTKAPVDPSALYFDAATGQEDQQRAEKGWPLLIDPILEWNAVALEANGVDHGLSVIEQEGPTRSSRALAIVHLAMYDAYNAVHKIGEPYQVLEKNPPANTNADLAASVAAYVTLKYLHPAQAKMFDEAIDQTIKRYSYSWPEYNAILLGKYVGLRMLWERRDDGSQIEGSYEPKRRPGFHNVDPLNPNQGFLGASWGQVRPFAIKSARQFAAPSPPSLDSVEYRVALEEVRRLGGDGKITPTERTPEQTIIGIFWAYNGLPKLGTPPRLYNQIVRVIAKQEKNTVADNARLFALVNMAMADAAIQSWHDKYHYELWRPILGIRYEQMKGVHQSEVEPLWTPLASPASNTQRRNFIPPFPAYTSGHAIFGAASMAMIAEFYGTDQIPFSFVSDEFNGETRDASGRVRPRIRRSYNTITEAIDENADSRIYLGVHWRFDCTEGVRSGRKISTYIVNNFLQAR